MYGTRRIDANRSNTTLNFIKQKTHFENDVSTLTPYRFLRQNADVRQAPVRAVVI